MESDIFSLRSDMDSSPRLAGDANAISFYKLWMETTVRDSKEELDLESL